MSLGTRIAEDSEGDWKGHRVSGGTSLKPDRIVQFLLCASNRAGVPSGDLREIISRAPDLEAQIIEAGEGSLECLRRDLHGADPDLIFAMLTSGQRDRTTTLLQAIRARFASCPLIAITEGMDGSELCALLREGASDFLTLPLRSTEVLPRVRRLLDQTRREDPLVRGLKEKLGLKQLIGESAALLAEIEKIPLVARSDATVLIAGETGTGKEMFAKAIHFLSPRSAKPFSPLNCGAIPVDLLENELFGHDAGAFTGASTSSPGVIRETEGGSLFLDEVDCLPAAAQVKLLRFLQERELRPLGARKATRVDVRLIAASNRNLEEAVRAGLFRRDLYYRLNVIGLSLPPLRERREDIPLLARHFVARQAEALGGEPKELTMSAMQKLMLYDWPGNVRELENVLQRAVVLSRRSILEASDIQLTSSVEVNEGDSFQNLKARMINEFERGYIMELLRKHNGNITRAARAAGKHRRAFWEVMRKHHIRVTQPPAPTL